MKEFFKDLKEELKEINIGDTEVEIHDKYKDMRISDRDINKSIDIILASKRK